MRYENMVAKTKTAKPARKAATKTAKAAARKAPAKPARKAVVKAAAKTAKKAAPKAAPKAARAPAKARPAAAKAAPRRPAPAAPVTPAGPRPAPAPKVAPPASAKEVAAAHEYLLSRSAHRSEEPVLVNGRRLPTEEQLLRMSDAAYMNDEQLAFFKHRLQRMEQELLANAGETTEHLRETVIVPDPADRATIEEEHALELRTRDRERKLLKKVQSALQRIESGEYGYCEETGDPIGVPRLLARPTATLSLEAQQRRELKQKLFGD
jgi:DnaK suppressor protein